MNVLIKNISNPTFYQYRLMKVMHEFIMEKDKKDICIDNQIRSIIWKIINNNDITLNKSQIRYISPEANIILEFEGESGWVWAEATGGNNPFGWMPEDLTDVAGYAYEVKEEPVSLSEYSGISPLTSSQSRGKGGISIAPFFGVIVFMLLIPILRRRHR